MSNLDISEKRLPQDGKIKFKRKGIPPFELRVATLPTAGGYEDAVMRILAKAEPPDTGSLNTRKDLSIGFLPQEPELNENLQVCPKCGYHRSTSETYGP